MAKNKDEEVKAPEPIEVDLSARGNIADIVGADVNRAIRGYMDGLVWSRVEINKTPTGYTLKVFQAVK